MKTLNKCYVDFSKWTGKIYRVSSVPSDNKNLESIIIEDEIIQKMYEDRLSLEIGYIGYDDKTKNYKAYMKTNIIHFPQEEENFIEISTVENDPDITITVYTNNKLMDISINYKAVKSWYNIRSKQDFIFKPNNSFSFNILNKQNELLQSIKLPFKSFLETFSATVDLSNIENLDNIKILTKRIVETYYLSIKKNKYTSLVNEDTIFSKADTTFIPGKHYNIVITKTNIENTIILKFKKLNMSTIYKSLNFYITGKDPNELHAVLSIPIEKLWNKKSLVEKIDVDLSDKCIWCDNREASILFNKKVVSI